MCPLRVVDSVRVCRPNTEMGCLDTNEFYVYLLGVARLVVQDDVPMFLKLDLVIRQMAYSIII